MEMTKSETKFKGFFTKSEIPILLTFLYVSRYKESAFERISMDIDDKKLQKNYHNWTKWITFRCNRSAHVYIKPWYSDEWRVLKFRIIYL